MTNYKVLRKIYLNFTLLISMFLVNHIYAKETQEEAKNFVADHLHEWIGWCSTEKAKAMMDSVFHLHPKVCVEIGVFGGTSVFPVAYALKHQGYGVLYGIDPWSNEECTKNFDDNDKHYVWWNDVDLMAVYNGFIYNLNRYQLGRQCLVIKATSEEAVDLIPSKIDMLHIDGNHSEESSTKDVLLYFQKVRRGGYIWFDDVNWMDKNNNNTTGAALSYLKERCEVVNEWKNYILLRKN